MTFTMYLAINGIIPPKQFEHNSILQNKHKDTVAMLLSKNKVIPPKEWNHDPQLQNDKGQTVAILLEIRGKETPEQWRYNPTHRLKYGFTTAMIVACSHGNKIVSNYWNHDPILIDNIYKRTVAMWLALSGVIPPKQWQHDSQLKDKDGKTVEYYLKKNNIKIPDNWNTTIQKTQISNKIKFYLAQYCKQYNITDPQLIINDPKYQKDNSHDTFAIYLELNNISIPKQFQYAPESRLSYQMTSAMRIALRGKIPSEQWQVDPSIIYNYKINGNTIERTIAHTLSEAGIIPTKEWQHDPQLKDNRGKTVQDYLIQNNKIVPNNWKVVQFSEQIDKYLNKYCKKYNVDRQVIIDNSCWQDNQFKETFAMYLVWYSIIPPKEFEHDSTIQNKNGDTVAIYLEIKNMPLVQQWQYDPLYKLKHNKTTAMRIAEKGTIPSNYWNHDPRLTDDYNSTVAFYLALNGVVPSKQWQLDPSIVYKYKEYNKNVETTIALKLASKGIVPPKEWQHDSKLKDNLGKTVENYLKENNKTIPDNWKTQQFNYQIEKYLNEYCGRYNIEYQTIINNPSWQNNEDYQTFAIYLAYNEIIPPKQFIHDPNIKGGEDDQTVREYLEQYYLPIPNEWYDDEYKQNNEKKLQYLNDALYGIKTEKPNNINPEQQYENGWTVAMIYAQNKIVPPKQWNHKPELQNFCGNTVAIYLAENGIIPPKKWYHDPLLIDYDGNTVAMYLAQNGIISPKEWEHQPDLQNTDNFTVAMLLASNGIIPPKEWIHNPYIADEDENTVQDYLIENNINIPEQWKYEDKQIEMTNEIQQLLDEFCEENDIENQQIIINYPQYQKYYDDDTFSVYLELHNIQTPKEFLYDPLYRLKYGMTTAMKIAESGKIPSDYWYHKPELQDDYGFTVAIYLVRKGVIPPKYWYHDPTMQNKWEYTVAMYLAENKILDIPKQWQHNPIIQNEKQQTIAMIYAYQGIIPPQQQNHNPNIKDKYGFTVQDYLQSNNIEVPEQWKTIDCGIKDKTIIEQLSDYCRRYDIDKQIIINNSGWQDNTDRKTFSMYLSQNKIIPPQQFIHNPNIKGGYYEYKTVREYLEDKKLLIPNEWYDDQYKKYNNYKPQYLNDALYGIITDKPDSIKAETQYEGGWTMAMIYAYQGIIPPQEWQHDPLLKDSQNKTVEDYLKQNNKEIPKCWQIIKQQQIQLDQKIIKYLDKYCNKYNTNKYTIIQDPSWQNKYQKLTFAIYLVDNKIIPPKQFIHDPNIKGGKDDQTVRQKLQYNYLPIPNEWYDDYYKQQHDYKPKCVNDAFYGIITERDENVKPEQQYENGWTVAMIYAYQGIIPPKQWNHNPNLTNYNKDTVAILLANNKILVPKEWQHDPKLKDYLGKTIEDYFKQNNKQVLEQQKITKQQQIQFDEQIEKYLDQYCKNYKINKQIIIDNPSWQNNQYKWTFAMYLADSKILPPKEFQHDPVLQNKQGSTVAVYLEINNIQIPDQWQYDPLYKLNNNMTTAMKIAEQGKIPSKYWQHNPLFKDDYGFTVQDHIQFYNLKVPIQWKTNNYNIQDKTIIKHLNDYCKEYNIDKQTIIKNPSWQDNNEQETFAMWLVWNKSIIPPKQFYHDPKIQDKYGDTVAVKLEVQRLEVPYQWKYNPLYRLKNNSTTAMRIASYKRIPSQYWEHNPLLKDDYDCTVGSILAGRGIGSPQWTYY